MENKNVSNFFIGFGIGLLVGGAIGILFAPDAGKVTRAEIAWKVNDIKKKLTK